MVPDRQVLEPDLFSQPDFHRLLIGGFTATLLMTFVMYASPWLGLANIDLAGLLGAMLSGSVPQIFGGPWWAGMVWHFINGAVLFPLIYVYLILPGRRGVPWVRGVWWGVTLWLLVQIIVMPMMGGGFFSRHLIHPGLVVFGSLIAHVVYGATLGAIAKLRPARFSEITQDRAA